MDAGDLSSLPQQAIAAIFAAIVLAAAITLIWGVAQWRKKGQFMTGGRWEGERVMVVEWAGREGYVRAGGELWRATSQSELSPGENVRVAGSDGLILEVEKD
jgi:membrane protein implicated in regulation of membrane protease activity